MKNRKGFTLIELIIVVAIIGILVMIAVPRFASATDSARINTWKANHRQYVSAVSLYVADHNGAYPTSKDDLVNYMTETDLDEQPVGATYTVGETVDGDPYPGAVIGYFELNGVDQEPLLWRP